MASRVLEPEVMDGEGEATAYDEIDRIWGDIILQGFVESAAMLGVNQGRVLDVGTGSGRIAIRLAKLNDALTIDAIDLSPSMLQLATANAAAAGVRNITFSAGDAKHIPFDDHTFDLVVCHQLLHQLPDPVVAMREINRVVKPNGALLVRDVRRLPEPLMTTALPFWCLGYSEKLREQTRGSFRAGLTKAEFRQLAQDARVERATIRTHFLTHQSIERVANPYQPFSRDGLPSFPPSVRAMKSLYVSRPHLRSTRA
jgi:ubiquinone/menaquinone biosynthesis C-methylase UbiE